MLRLGLLSMIVASVFGATSAYADTVYWRFRSHHPNIVDVKLFSQDRRHVWPSSSTVWSINDYNVNGMTISCVSGEKICYGAWVRGSGSSYWGVGRDGREACSNCCFVCGTGDTPIFDLYP